MKQSDEARSACASQRRKRREKMLDAGDLRLLILDFLQAGPAHGYELIKAIETLSQGEYSPSPGMIYPNLTLLEEMGYISVVDPLAARKACQLEAEGRQWLARHPVELRAVRERLGSLAILAGNRSRPEMDRAVQNLRAALHARLAQPDLSREVLHALIDVLDEAAKKIERA
ncbi:PadR family transcriptional regulator [Pantoea sp. 1.19]|uniref:PadR family transcriptional regulator n=1 Tax=Pantoea sp. 1.19 TaxID=1925589 RepID=UPI0009489D56|nr:PadR family transcriptional regulator [Pantoea sp. 1.19]